MEKYEYKNIKTGLTLTWDVFKYRKKNKKKKSVWV